MDAQQLHDYIIKPTLQYMGGNYYSKESAFLLLCTAAIESNCGEYIKQVNGPALGVWQMEPATHNDIWDNCDALKGFESSLVRSVVFSLAPLGKCGNEALMASPMYACAMARLKYSMDPNPLPKLTGDSSVDLKSFYSVYKKIYNTKYGKSTYEKWVNSISSNKILEVDLHGEEN